MTFRQNLAVLALPCALTIASAHPVGFAKQQLADQFYAEGVAVADTNRDGHLDVIAGPLVYLGPEYTKKQQLAAPLAYDPHSYSNAFIMGTHDFNGDGWTDVLRGGWPGRAAHWLQNPREKGGDWPEHILHPTVGTESPTLVDLVGDEAVEFIFATDQKLGWAAPGASPRDPWIFHPVTPAEHWQRYTHGLGAGDVNGDGRPDLLTATGWFAQPVDTSEDVQWDFHPAEFGTKGGAQMFAYDVNGDGLNDVITSIHAHGYGISWFEQKHDANGVVTWIDHPIVSREPNTPIRGVQFSQPHAVEIADIDGDGLMDIISGKRYWAHGPTGDVDPLDPAVIFWFQLVRDGDQTYFEPHLIDSASGVGCQFVVADMNQDGHPDIVTSNKAGVFVFTQQR